MNLLKITTVFAFLMVSVFSCKQNSEKKNIDIQSDEQTNTKKEISEAPSHFSLTLRALVQTDDNFEIFYVQENSESYSVDRLLSQKVIGSTQFQDITFDMPDQFYPFNIRLDLGTNASQSSIKIETCTLDYGSSVYVIKGSEMIKFFTFNEGVEVLSDSTTFKLKSFKDGTKDKYDPFMIGNLKLNDVLLKKL